MRNKGLAMVIGFLLLFICIVPQEKLSAEGKSYENREAALTQETAKLEGKPGTYLVLLSYEENHKIVEESVYVTVLGDDTVVQKNIAINATPIAIAQDQVGNLTEQEWIAMADAKAWNTETGEAISITKVNADAVKNQIGSYPVTFSTVNKIQTTIQVEVVLDQQTENDLKLYYQNQEAGNFEENYDSSQINWSDFEKGFVVVMRYLVIVFLFIPIIALLLVYIFTRKLVKQVVKLVIK